MSKSHFDLSPLSRGLSAHRPLLPASLSFPRFAISARNSWLSSRRPCPLLLTEKCLPDVLPLLRQHFPAKCCCASSLLPAVRLCARPAAAFWVEPAPRPLISERGAPRVRRRGARVLRQEPLGRSVFLWCDCGSGVREPSPSPGELWRGRVCVCVCVCACPLQVGARAVTREVCVQTECGHVRGEEALLTRHRALTRAGSHRGPSTAQQNPGAGDPWLLPYGHGLGPGRCRLASWGAVSTPPSPSLWPEPHPSAWTSASPAHGGGHRT